MRFSEIFDLDRTQAYLDFVDIRVDTDIPVFLDPSAIKSLNSTWGHELAFYLQNFFETVLERIREGDDKGARTLLSSLNERNEFHLGYCRGKSRGRAFGSSKAKDVWSALSKSRAAKSGLIKDLEDSALMIHGIGNDMISDAVCNILRGPLIKYTQDMCLYYDVPLTEKVASGPIWDPVNKRWEQTLLPLPVHEHKSIILVPKILVRHRIGFQYDEYYTHYLLPYMQDEHIRNNSSLVETLINGSKRVTKKSLKEKYGTGKLAVVEQTINRSQVLDEYREAKVESPSSPISLEQFSELENVDKPDFTDLLKQLDAVPFGSDSATAYENIIESIFSALFYPSLCNPIKQDRINNGRKRIDITYTNEAKGGFFRWLSLHYPCSMVFVECKNYGNEVANPEVDQLSGRFSKSRGVVGILVYRQVENKKLLIDRCVDTAHDDRGFIIALDDADIKKIIDDYIETDGSQEFPYLRAIFNKLIK